MRVAASSAALLVGALLVGALVCGAPSSGVAQSSVSSPSSSPSAAVAGPAVRVEGVAAIVGSGDRTISVLRTDVTLRARLLLAGHATRLPVGPLPASLLSTTLDTLIGEALIAREADRLQAGDPSAEQIAEEREALEAAAGGGDHLTALLTRLGVREEELIAIATRRAYVQAFLRVNLEGSTVVSDSQVERVYASGEHPFGERPLEVIHDVLRRWIAAQSLERDVARWVEVLRNRTPVRVVADWGAAVPPAEGPGRAAQ